MSFTESEVKLLEGANRKIVLSVLKAMWETNIDCDVINAMHLSNLLLIECEKHQNEEEWAPEVIGDRIIGTLLQVPFQFPFNVFLSFHSLYPACSPESAHTSCWTMSICSRNGLFGSFQRRFAQN